MTASAREIWIRLTIVRWIELIDTPCSNNEMNYESIEDRLMRSYSLPNIFHPRAYANEPLTLVDLCQILIHIQHANRIHHVLLS